MYLKEIRIRTTKAIRNRYEPPFEWTLHHVRQIYMSLLPSKFTLDGSSLLQIHCGSIDEISKDPNALGITNYYCEEFDFESYYKFPTKREDVIIKLIESSMLSIVSQLDLDIDQTLILKTSEEVRQCNCSLKIHIKKLSKKYPKSKLKVNVYRNLSKEDGETWSIELRSKENTLFEGYLKERPDYLDRSDYFKRSFWQDNFFIIHCNLNKEVFRFDIGRFL
jgi:hypothetical protein